MTDRQTDDRQTNHAMEMCSYSRNHLQFQSFRLIIVNVIVISVFYNIPLMYMLYIYGTIRRAPSLYH